MEIGFDCSIPKVGSISDCLSFSPTSLRQCQPLNPLGGCKVVNTATVTTTSGSTQTSASNVLVNAVLKLDKIALYSPPGGPAPDCTAATYTDTPTNVYLSNTVRYCVRVHNMQATAVNNVVVKDDNGTPYTTTDDRLFLIGTIESNSYKYVSYDAVMGDVGSLINTAWATGDLTGAAVTALDKSYVNVKPIASIRKYVSLTSDNCTNPSQLVPFELGAAAQSYVTYCYFVRVEGGYLTDFRLFEQSSYFVPGRELFCDQPLTDEDMDGQLDDLANGVTCTARIDFFVPNAIATVDKALAYYTGKAGTRDQLGIASTEVCACGHSAFLSKLLHSYRDCSSVSQLPRMGPSLSSSAASQTFYIYCYLLLLRL